MGVYIKGMEMPKDKPIRIVLNPNGQLFVDHGVHFTEYEAVELPSHGDLIDRDALNDMINRSYPMTDRVDVHNGYAICQELIKMLPIIIEAEGGT